VRAKIRLRRTITRHKNHKPVVGLAPIDTVGVQVYAQILVFAYRVLILLTVPMTSAKRAAPGAQLPAAACSVHSGAVSPSCTSAYIVVFLLAG